MIAVGVDTHKDVHVVAALDALGQLLGETVVPASEAGYHELAAWLARLGEGLHSASGRGPRRRCRGGMRRCR